MLVKVVSGGQTGADRGGLNAALSLGLPIGGYCPRGRKAEDGRVPDKFPLLETVSSGYAERTRLNVIESDGTVVFTHGPITPGSQLTLDVAAEVRRPVLHVNLQKGADAERRVQLWLTEHGIKTLNVAGTRESKAPGIERRVGEVLANAISLQYKIARKRIPSRKKRHSTATCKNCGATIASHGRKIHGFRLEEVRCKRCGWGLVLREAIPRWRPLPRKQVLAFLRCPEHKKRAVSNGRGQWICPRCGGKLGGERQRGMERT